MQRCLIPWIGLFINANPYGLCGFCVGAMYYIQPHLGDGLARPRDVQNDYCRKDIDHDLYNHRCEPSHHECLMINLHFTFRTINLLITTEKPDRACVSCRRPIARPASRMRQHRRATNELSIFTWCAIPNYYVGISNAWFLQIAIFAINKPFGFTQIMIYYACQLQNNAFKIYEINKLICNDKTTKND